MSQLNNNSNSLTLNESYFKYVIKKPITWISIVIITVYFGLVSCYQMPISEDSNCAYSENVYSLEINYSSSVDNASLSITNVLLKSALNLTGLLYCTTKTGTDMVSMRFFFEQGVAGESLIRTIMDENSRRLPSEINYRISKGNNAANKSIFKVFFYSKDKAINKDRLSSIITPFIDQLGSEMGIANILTQGASDKKIVLNIKPSICHAYNVHVKGILDSLNALKINCGATKFKDKFRNISTEITNKDESNTMSVEQKIGQISVLNTNNQLIALEKVVDINLGDASKEFFKINNEEVIAAVFFKTNDANLIKVCNNLTKRIKEIELILGKQGVGVGILEDSSLFVKSGINNIFHSIIEAILLVVIIVSWFFKSPKVAAIILLSIPTSILPTFFVLNKLGYTINVYTLFAVILATGTNVDDATIVAESIIGNIERKVEFGEKLSLRLIQKCVSKSVSKIFFSIIAMTITLVAVYIPVMIFQNQFLADFFEFALTLSISMLLSGFVAVTIIPIIFYYIITPKDISVLSSKESILDSTNKGLTTLKNIFWSINNILDFIVNSYRKFMQYCFNKLNFILSLSIIVLSFSSYYLYSSLDKNMNTDLDNGTMVFGITLSEKFKSETIQDSLKNFIDNVKKIPEYHDVETYISNVSEIRNSDLTLKLKPIKKRKYTVDQIEKAFLQVLYKTENKIRLNMQKSKTTINLYTQSAGISDFNIANKNGDKLMEALSRKIVELQKKRGCKIEHLKYAYDHIMNMQVYQIFLNNQECVKHHIQVPELLSIITSITGENYRYKVSDYQTGNVLTVHLIPYLSSPSEILDIPLFEVRNIYYDELFRENVNFKNSETQPNTQKIVTLRPFTSPETNNSFVNKLDCNHYCMNMHGKNYYIVLPNGISQFDLLNLIKEVNAESNSETFLKIHPLDEKKIEESYQLFLIFISSILLLFLILAIQFNSFIDPLIILSSIPFAVIGGLLGLKIVNLPLNVVGIIGIITLLGLITKHSILILDAANKKISNIDLSTLVIKNDLSKIIFNIAVSASLERFRAIAMTTLCMVFGALPLLQKQIELNELRRPIGAVLVCGMVFGTIITMFIVPLFYTKVKTLWMYYYPLNKDE